MGADKHATASEPQTQAALIARFAPWIFVLFWSTGFISAKYGLPYAEPFTFLALRMMIACALMSGLALLLDAQFPRQPKVAAHIAVSGLLLHVGYLGGVFFAISRGMPSGLSALVVGLQPILTAIFAQMLLREPISPRHWTGLILGFIGVGLVVEEKVTASLDSEIAFSAFIAIVIALIATTAGTIYQKRYVYGTHLTAVAATQYATSALVFSLIAIGFETRQIDWNVHFIGAVAWAVVVLSFGAVLLLLWLIREHSVSRIASLMYLVPPATAIEAYLLFDERLGPVAIVGMAVAAFGVALVVTRIGVRSGRERAA